MTNYSELTHNSPFAIKRLSHGARFKSYCEFLVENQSSVKNQDFLDYGSGDGHLFNVLKAAGINSYKLHAFEPVPSQFEQLVANVSKNNLDVDCLTVLEKNKKFDIILCAEVLEHFSACNVLFHLAEIKDILSSEGKLLVSVPVEIGLAGLSKNIARALIGQLHKGLNFQAIIKSFFDIPIDRGDDYYISSHVGFSHKKLEYLLVDAGFTVEKKYFSPFPFMRSVANSQAFFECKIKT